jgi:hypothetical protein
MDTLKEGCTASVLPALQQQLKAKGFPPEAIDGTFGRYRGGGLSVPEESRCSTVTTHSGVSNFLLSVFAC